MKLSTRARYGLKALIDLGLHSANEAISLQSIAERQDISTSYLEQLMAMLKKAGLVKSSRGAYGGYQLGKPADEISVGEVLRVLEGSLEAAALFLSIEPLSDRASYSVSFAADQTDQDASCDLPACSQAFFIFSFTAL